MSLQQFERKSLQEINQSIDVPKGIPFWKTCPGFEPLAVHSRELFLET